MAFLTGNTVQSTYKSLIKVDDNGELNATTPKSLTDGFGNPMPLQASQNQIKFTGILDAGSATSIIGLDAPKNIVIDGVGTWTADQVEDTVTFAGGNNVTIGLAGDTITWNVATASLDGYATEAYVLSQTASLSASLAVDIAANTADIATNAGDISTNSSLISANATDISNILAGIGNVISVNGVDGAITIDAGAGIGVNTNVVTGQVTISNTAIPDTGSLLVTASAVDNVITFEKGDGSTFPVTIDTGSGGGGVTINNNTDGYLLTATGTPNTIDGEPKLRWNTSTQTLTLESGNSTNGLTFDGGVFGAANPKISTTGFTGINVDTNLILENQTKIAFDTDAANTYIAADLTTPENLTINADGYVDVYIADGFRVWENNAAPAAMFKVEKSGDFPRVGIGASVTTTDSELYVDGVVEATEFLYDYNNEPLNYQGETIRLGTTSTTAGLLYAWSGTSWVLADADVENTARALLGIAIANTSDKGMLVNGWYKTGTTYSNGQLYMSATAGGFTTTPPSTTGQVIRIVGHGINSTTIRFNPSNEYYTVE